MRSLETKTKKKTNGKEGSPRADDMDLNSKLDEKCEGEPRSSSKENENENENENEGQGEVLARSSSSGKRKRFLPYQLSELMQVFEKVTTPCFEIREELSLKLKMSNREVQVWFQNRRAKVNRQKHNQKLRFLHHPSMKVKVEPDGTKEDTVLLANRQGCKGLGAQGHTFQMVGEPIHWTVPACQPKPTLAPTSALGLNWNPASTQEVNCHHQFITPKPAFSQRLVETPVGKERKRFAVPPSIKVPKFNPNLTPTRIEGRGGTIEPNLPPKTAPAYFNCTFTSNPNPCHPTRFNSVNPYLRSPPPPTTAAAAAAVTPFSNNFNLTQTQAQSKPYLYQPRSATFPSNSLPNFNSTCNFSPISPHSLLLLTPNSTNTSFDILPEMVQLPTLGSPNPFPTQPNLNLVQLPSIHQLGLDQ